MPDSERRKQEAQRLAELKSELNEAQQQTLSQMEQFGWELKFVRHKAFSAGVPVVFDGDRKKFAVLNEDGSLNENPDFDIRH